VDAAAHFQRILFDLKNCQKENKIGPRMPRLKPVKKLSEILVQFFVDWLHCHAKVTFCVNFSHLCRSSVIPKAPKVKNDASKICDSKRHLRVNVVNLNCRHFPAFLKQKNDHLNLKLSIENRSFSSGKYIA
jgi:hypothetical protein